MNNYCFIDSQNLYQGVKGHGWQLDYRRFRGWLKNRYHITRAFMFFGYVKDNEGCIGA